MLAEVIGTPAMLEQTAEECAELAKACLKIARFMRGDNPVHQTTIKEMYQNLSEEMADMYICCSELAEHLEMHDAIDSDIVFKRTRMACRLDGSEELESHNVDPDILGELAVKYGINSPE